jgi:peptide/nickel transport system permease protein
MNKEEFKRALKKIVTNPSAMLGFILLIIFIIIGILAPVIAPPEVPINNNLEHISSLLEDYESGNKQEIINNFETFLDDEYYYTFLDNEYILELEQKLNQFQNNEIDLENFKMYLNDLTDQYIIEGYILDVFNENQEEGIKEIENKIANYKEKYERGKTLEENISILKNLEGSDFENKAKGIYETTYNDYTENINYDPYIMRRVSQRNEPQPPSDEYLFGISSGRDIYYGVVWGTRTAFKIGLVVVSIATVVGVFIGSIAAYFGGWVDEILMRITDIFLSIPFFLGAMVITTVLGTGLDKVIISMTVLGWMVTARLIRGNILQEKNEQYVLAAKALGVSNFKIIFFQILPNTIFPVVVQASMRIGSLVITAAALSFLGLGAPQGYADWGSILSYARDWMAVDYWYIIVFPGIAMVFFVLSWNLVGDALRDIFDPKMKM